MMTAHRLARRLLVAALPLTVMGIGGNGHTRPLPSVGAPVTSLPTTDNAPAAPGLGESRRHSDTLRTDVLKTYGHLPLQFEANLGQTESTVKFLARGPGYTVFLTPSEAVLVLRSPEPSEQTHGPVLPGLDRRPPRLRERKTSPERDATVVRLGLVGANPNPELAGLEPLPGKVNYFRGNDPHKWRTGVPTYTKVRYRDVYAGVDVVYYGAQRQLEYDFVVAPGADPTRIRLAVTGAEALGVDGAGDLLLTTATGALRLHKPLIYQEGDAGRQEIAGGYVLLGKDRVGFRVAAYDAGRPLVIDPVLSYSTYLGGICGDAGYGIAVDSAGDIYVTGQTCSSDFPSVNALQPTWRGADVFVAKINAAGSAFVYSTYLGGSSEDAGRSIAVDSVGNAYVSGHTYSSDFPTVNALQSTRGGPYDGFVAKINAAGSALIYSTYLGGNDHDSTLGIAVDSAGNAYVTGYTFSPDFPTVNALQPTKPAVFGPDAFVAKISAAGSLVYSTYLGGSGDEQGSGIAVDDAGNAYVAGYTSSPDFPVANALQPSLKGVADAFVAKLNAAGSALVYSTYLGGYDDWHCDDYWGYCFTGDYATGIAVDGAGNAYVVGYTYSSDFPTANALQPWGGFDAFVAKLNAAGSALVYSTFLGGSNDFFCDYYYGCYGGDYGSSIAVDGAGNAYVTGYTYALDFPTVNPIQFQTGSRDVFVAKINAAGSALVFSTYLGGSREDAGLGIAVDSAGDAYVIGETYSTDFTTLNPLQATFGGSIDAFVAKFSFASTTNQPPLASFSSACAGLMCAFDGSSSSDPDGTIMAYSWSFGDGTNGSGRTPSHTYAAAGTYAVSLTVTDNAGATGTHSSSVAVVNGPPIPSFTSACTGTACSFDGSASSDSDGTITGYSWNFGDGTTGFRRLVNHLYAAAGTYTVELTVTDNASATGSQSKSVTVIVALSSLNLNPASVTAGNASSGTVILNAPAAAGGAVVALASSNPAIATVPTSVTVTAGASSATFAVSTVACASGSVTISGTYGGVTQSAGLSVTVSATDTITIQQADYFASKRQLRVGAKSISSNATLQVYVTSTGALIGTLQNLGDGRYTGQFNWPVYPQTITVRSSLCGSATKAVTAK
jgi:PKD repeat protein